MKQIGNMEMKYYKHSIIPDDYTMSYTFIVKGIAEEHKGQTYFRYIEASTKFTESHDGNSCSTTDITTLTPYSILSDLVTEIDKTEYTRTKENWEAKYKSYIKKLQG